MYSFRYETVARLSDGSEVPFGMMVWKAGLSQVKLVENTPEFERGPTGRILVNKFLRAKFTCTAMGGGGGGSSGDGDSEGAMAIAKAKATAKVKGTGEGAAAGGGEDDLAYWAEAHGGRVYAMGDCAANPDAPLAPLASVAEQQADYLAHCFNNTYYDHIVAERKREQQGGASSSSTVSSSSSFSVSPMPLPDPVLPSSFPPVPSFMFDASRSFRYVTRGSMVVSLHSFSSTNCSLSRRTMYTEI